MSRVIMKHSHADVISDDINPVVSVEVRIYPSGKAYWGNLRTKSRFIAGKNIDI